MGLSSQHLFLFVHPVRFWTGPTVTSLGLDLNYVRCRQINYWRADQGFKSILRQKSLAQIPSISIWWSRPSLTESDLFQLRSYSERYRLIQLRKPDVWKRSMFSKSAEKLAAKELVEVAGSECTWLAHHDPCSLADFYGMSLLREDFVKIAGSESNLRNPRTWAESAVKHRFDLQFVPRAAESQAL